MKNTKWQLKILESHSKSNVIDIDDIYSTYSYAKRRAFERCYNEYSLTSMYTNHLSHFHFRIISFNKMMFTCGYYFYDKVGSNTHLFFKYFSHRRTVEFKVHDLSYFRNC